MENRRVSQWVDSISSVIRKTELNLTMVSRKPTFLEVSLDRPEESRVDSNFSDVQRELRAVKTALERTVTDAAAAHKQEVDALMTRLAEAEVRQRSGSANVRPTQMLEEHNRLKAQFEGVLDQKAAELQAKCKDFVLKSELQTAEAALKQIHTQDQQTLERKVQSALLELETARTRTKREVDERIRELSSQLVRADELANLRTELMQAVDAQVRRVETDLKEQLTTLQTELLAENQKKLEALKTSVRAEWQNELRQAEAEVEELTKTVTSLRQQLTQQRQESTAKLATVSAAAEELAAHYERTQTEMRKLKALVEGLPEDRSEEYYNFLSAKLKEVEKCAQESSDGEEIRILEQLEQRVRQLEENLSVDSSVTDNEELEISAGEVIPRGPLASEGLATFGKGRDLKPGSPISQQGSSELMAITLNDVGESDDADSADYVSPHISPMNKWVPQHGAKAEEAKQSEGKHFAFEEQKVPEAIKEAPHEEEVEVNEGKVKRIVDRFCSDAVAEALNLVVFEDQASSEVRFSLEEFDLP